MLQFTSYTNQLYVPAPVHVLMAEKLDKFLDDCHAGKSPRLIISMPPRHGKSELVSRRFPAYALGRHPDMSIISTSYAADLSSRFNRDVQRIIDSPTYAEVFPKTTLYGKNIRSAASGAYMRNSDIFEVVGHRGSYRSAGVGGGISGMGAHALIIDDPIKDVAEAQSELQRESLKDWFAGVAYLRLEPGGGVIVCMTRWHMDDLAGWLIAKGLSGETELWEEVRFPAVAEGEDVLGRTEGDALDTGRYPIDALDRIKATIGNWQWASLYQQRPVPREGGLFKRAWFADKIIAEPPQGTRWVRHWDLAATAKKTAARTAGVKLGRTPDGKYIVGHVITMQEEGNAVRKAILATAQSDGTSCEVSLPQDPGQAGKVQKADLIGMLAGFVARAEPETGDKVTRAEPYAAQCEAGNVHLVRGPWNESYLDEVCLFPGGVFKDQVDASSGAFGRLANARPIAVFGRYGTA